MSAEFLSRAVWRSCIHLIEEEDALVVEVVVVAVGMLEPISLRPSAEGREDIASRKEETGTGAQVDKNTARRVVKKEMVMGLLLLVVVCVCVDIYVRNEN